MVESTRMDAPQENSAESPWPAELDALIAAPAHHALLFENDRVRVLDTNIAAGDRTPVHTHRWPVALCILSWSAFVRYDAEGGVLLDSRTVPALAGGVVGAIASACARKCGRDRYARDQR